MLKKKYYFNHPICNNYSKNPQISRKLYRISLYQDRDDGTIYLKEKNSYKIDFKYQG